LTWKDAELIILMRSQGMDLFGFKSRMNMIFQERRRLKWLMSLAKNVWLAEPVLRNVLSRPSLRNNENGDRILRGDEEASLILGPKDPSPANVKITG
jgi:hypothetical protein